MDKSHLFQHEWHNQTTLHPLGLVAVLVLGAALLLLPRRYATWPLIALACFVASSQRVVIMGADFTLLRILIIFGTCRVAIRNEFTHIHWSRLDTTLVCWALASTILPMIRTGPDLLMNRLGHLYDVLGMYYISRCIIQNWNDIVGVARGLMCFSIPVAFSFILEWATARNAFSVFGGVPEVTMVRDGRLRCQGAFSHPILAGCFWAAALPLMATQWWHRRRGLAVTSCGAALFIIFACASATPVFGVLTACLGAGMYYARHHLRLVRWSIVATLVGLHMVMNAPVWHLIARTSSLGGSSWHRYALLDGAIRHAHEWWLMGSVVGTAHWGHATFDVTNYYIVQAIHGGIVLLLLFCCVIAVSFSHIGRAMRAAGMLLTQKVMIWALGVSLLVHAVNHFGVTYFGQIWLSWYMLLGMIASLPAVVGRTERAADPTIVMLDGGAPSIPYRDTDSPFLNHPRTAR